MVLSKFVKMGGTTLGFMGLVLSCSGSDSPKTEATQEGERDYYRYVTEPIDWFCYLNREDLRSGDGSCPELMREEVDNMDGALQQAREDLRLEDGSCPKLISLRTCKEVDNIDDALKQAIECKCKNKEIKYCIEDLRALKLFLERENVFPDGDCRIREEVLSKVFLEEEDLECIDMIKSIDLNAIESKKIKTFIQALQGIVFRKEEGRSLSIPDWIVDSYGEACIIDAEDSDKDTSEPEKTDDVFAELYGREFIDEISAEFSRMSKEELASIVKKQPRRRANSQASSTVPSRNASPEEGLLE